MPLLMANNASTTLAANISNTAIYITVASPSGFPTPSGTSVFYATLVNSSNQVEVVKCTALNTNIFTVVRAQDGTGVTANTTGYTYATGDRFELRPTAAAFNAKLDADTAASTYAPLASPALTGTPTVPTAAPGTDTTQAASTAFVAAVSTSLSASIAAKADSASPTFTGTVTLPDTTTVNGQTAGYRNIPQNAQNAGYTFALTDAGKHIFANTAGTFTIPANASVAFPIGTAITFVNTTGSNCTIAIGGTDVLRQGGTSGTGSRTIAGTNGVATLLKIGATTWVISGIGVT